MNVRIIESFFEIFIENIISDNILTIFTRCKKYIYSLASNQ